jgi:hypothetical protein
MRSMPLGSFLNAIAVISILLAMALLSACDGSLVHVSTNVTLSCPPSQGGPPPDDEPGISCGGTNKIAVSAGTPVATNAIQINPLGTPPAGSTCSGGYKCKAGIPGQQCGLSLTTKCKDTWDSSSRMCDCQCR